MAEHITERWISLKDAAVHLNVSTSWLYQRGKDAGVPRARIGNKYRYLASQLDAWMQEKGNE